MTKEFFLWQWDRVLRINRGEVIKGGYGDTETVATFDLDILGEQDSLNTAYAFLKILQENGHAVNWDLDFVFIEPSS
jgi:hypothetical protein